MQTADKEHIIAIMDEYTKACEKHPIFCKKLTLLDLESVRNSLGCYRFLNDCQSTGHCIFQEELNEALEAYLEGNKANALQELAQCGAVILRMMDFVKKEKNVQDTEQKRKRRKQHLQNVNTARISME